METQERFSTEDLEIVPLPEREAMGLIKVNNVGRQSGGGRGGNNVGVLGAFLGIFL